MLPIPHPPQVFCHCFFFWNSCNCPVVGQLALTKKLTVGLKKVCICLTLGQYQKKVLALYFPINVSWKCHIGQYISDLIINISNIYITIKVLLILFTFAITHSYHIWKLLKKIKLAMCVFGQQSDSSLLLFSQTCDFWSSKANWRLRFSLLSIILMDLLGNKTLL